VISQNAGLGAQGTGHRAQGVGRRKEQVPESAKICGKPLRKSARKKKFS